MTVREFWCRMCDGVDWVRIFAGSEEEAAADFIRARDNKLSLPCATPPLNPWQVFVKENGKDAVRCRVISTLEYRGIRHEKSSP